MRERETDRQTDRRTDIEIEDERGRKIRVRQKKRRHSEIVRERKKKNCIRSEREIGR